MNIWNSISSMTLVENLSFTYIIVFDILGFKCGDLWLTEKGWPLLSNKVSPEHCFGTEQITAGFKQRRLHCGRDQLQSICLYRFQPTGGSLGPVLWTYVQASHFLNKLFYPLRMILWIYCICKGFLFSEIKLSSCILCEQDMFSKQSVVYWLLILWHEVMKFYKRRLLEPSTALKW